MAQSVEHFDVSVDSIFLLLPSMLHVQNVTGVRLY